MAVLLTKSNTDIAYEFPKGLLDCHELFADLWPNDDESDLSSIESVHITDSGKTRDACELNDEIMGELNRFSHYHTTTDHMNALPSTPWQESDRRNTKNGIQLLQSSEEEGSDTATSHLIPELDLDNEVIASMFKEGDGHSGIGAPFRWDDEDDDNTSIEVADPSKIIPGQFDVLLGRGAGYHGHTGNVRLRNLIKPWVEAHKACQTPEEKVLITLGIVYEIQTKGGRFLKRDGMAWIEISDHEARQKVGHTFRNMRAPARDSSTKNQKLDSKRMNHEDQSDSRLSKKRKI